MFDTTFLRKYPSLVEAEADLRELLLALPATQGGYLEAPFYLKSWAEDWVDGTEGLSLDEAVAALHRWYSHWRAVITADQQRGLLRSVDTFAVLMGYPDAVRVHIRDARDDPVHGRYAQAGLHATVARRSAQQWAVLADNARTWLHEVACFGVEEVQNELIAAGDEALAAEVRRVTVKPPPRRRFITKSRDPRRKPREES